VAIALKQTVTGTGALVLNNVVAGNALVCWQSMYRASGSGAVTVPTDSAGTFTGGIAGAGAVFNASEGIAVGLFYEANAAAGTHTVTPESATIDHGTLSEFSGMATSGLLDVSATAKTENATVTSQATGTTGTTAQDDELIAIGMAIGHTAGVADIGWTDPVTGFTTLFTFANTSTDVGTFHAYKIVSATGTQSATFSWSDSEVGSEHAAIATFKAGIPPLNPSFTPFPKPKLIR
jgi:hypothetical protein